MTFRREPPPPPKSDPPSVLLLRAIGDLQEMEEGEAITDMDAIALASGLVYIEVPALIEAGIRAGYLEMEDDGAVSLTDQGMRWYVRDAERRS